MRSCWIHLIPCLFRFVAFNAWPKTVSNNNHKPESIRVITNREEYVAWANMWSSYLDKLVIQKKNEKGKWESVKEIAHKGAGGTVESVQVLFDSGETIVSDQFQSIMDTDWNLGTTNSYLPKDMSDELSNFFGDPSLLDTVAKSELPSVPYVVSNDFKTANYRIQYHFQGMQKSALNAGENAMPPPPVIVEGNVRLFIYAPHDKKRIGLVYHINDTEVQQDYHKKKGEGQSKKVPVGVFGIVSVRNIIHSEGGTSTDYPLLELLPHDDCRDVQLEFGSLHSAHSADP